jgi:hypothetical protein
MSVVRRFVFACVATVLGASPAFAQASAINDLLARASVALNDLRYRDALTIGREVLALGARVNRDEERQALRIIAAAQFPEEREARDAAGARQTLAQLIRHDPSARVPREISWRGLDSLADVVRRSTFGARAVLPKELALTGSDTAMLAISLRANRPAIAELRLAPLAGGAAPIEWSQATPTLDDEVQLRIPPEWVTTGAHEFRVLWRSTDGDTTSSRFLVHLEGSNLALEPMPEPPPANAQRAEREPPRRRVALAAAATAAGLTLLGAQRTQGDAPIDGVAGGRRAATTVAVGLLLAGATAAVLDKGHALEANIVYNRELSVRFERERSRVAASNADRRRTWTATLVNDGEVR